jgi:hypothetical protein
MPTAFYQQASYVPFEDMQLVQRGPTMAYYYDQTAPATSLAGVRSDGTTPNLAYPTMSADGRFARTDNSSPVQSQQTGSTGQTMMNATMMNPQYAYFYGANVMPGSFQQFPPIYSAVSYKLLLVNFYIYEFSHLLLANASNKSNRRAICKAIDLWQWLWISRLRYAESNSF